MEEKKLTSLIFGNVVIESSLMGGSLRVYSPDMRSYSELTHHGITLKAPLDELRGDVPPENLDELCERIFRDVESELEKHYPGGVARARRELRDWLSRIPDNPVV